MARALQDGKLKLNCSIREETPKKCVTAISCCTATYNVLLGTFKGLSVPIRDSLPEMIHQMTTNLDIRGGRLERLAKLAQSALVEDLNCMVARESNRNRGRSCPPT